MSFLFPRTLPPELRTRNPFKLLCREAGAWGGGGRDYLCYCNGWGLGARGSRIHPEHRLRHEPWFKRGCVDGCLARESRTDEWRNFMRYEFSSYGQSNISDDNDNVRDIYDEIGMI
jgi:hypothetical protein